MGPYCRFCGSRCFVPPPHNTPRAYLAIIEAQSIAGLILATCPAGKALERERLGFCLDDIRATILKQEAT